MSWKIKGQVVETCSCNMLCPCWFGIKELMIMDKGWCASAFLYRVQEGSSDKIDLSKRLAVLVIDFPGPTLYDGNAIARLYVDDGTSADQCRELEAIFQGKKGGPMEAFAGLIPKWLPTQITKIEVKEEGDVLSATVGRFGRMKSQRLKNDAGQPMTMQNTGFQYAFQFGTGQFAPSNGTKWSDPDLPHQFDNKSGVAASFAWSGS